MRSWTVRTIALTVLLAGAVGCDEEPTAPEAQGFFIRPGDPQPSDVFAAMRESINDSRDDANYRNALSDDFLFSPLPEDSLSQDFVGTGVYDHWDKETELGALSSLLADSDYLYVDFTPALEINQSTFVRFRVDYVLDVASAAAPLDTIQYRGLALFDVRRSNGAWRLERWDEIANEGGYQSWGYLRGFLRAAEKP
jgi:hypothetical protein